MIIEGSEDFIAWVEAALDLLKDNAPEWYVYADNGLNKVVERLDIVGVYTGRKIFYYHRRNPDRFRQGCGLAGLMNKHSG